MNYRPEPEKSVLMVELFIHMRQEVNAAKHAQVRLYAKAGQIYTLKRTTGERQSIPSSFMNAQWQMFVWVA